MPEIGKKIAYKANRAGVAERFTDPAVQKSIEVDLALIDYYDQLLRDLELAIVKTAKQHDANTLYGSVAKFDFWAKSKNWMSGIQWLTDSQTLEKASLRQNLIGYPWGH